MKRLLLLFVAITTGVLIRAANNQPISFADAEVKRICVANWDTDGDGELSYDEAAAVTDLGEVFKSNRQITSFDELQFFTGITEIPTEAFRYCESLQSIILPENLSSIGGWAFYGCKSLQSLFVPQNVSSIAGNIFPDATALKSVIVSPKNEKYDSRDNCNAIIETETNKLIAGCNNSFVPNGVVALGHSSFVNCRELEEIALPNSLTTIEYQSFFNCNSLRSIKIPASVTYIQPGVFLACYSLISMTVEEGNTRYDSRDGCNAIIETSTNKLLYGCNTTIIPSSVTQIGNSAFIGQKYLTRITIPEGVNTIGISAFSGTKLSTLTLPSTIKEIGEEAFQNNTNLETIYCHRQQPPTLGADAFVELIAQAEYIYQHAVLYVPKGCKEAYQEASEWKRFTNIVEMDDGPEALMGDVNSDGEVDLSDAIMVIYYSLDMNPDGFNAAVADMNGDGEIDLSDAIMIIYKSMPASQNGN